MWRRVAVLLLCLLGLPTFASERLVVVDGALTEIIYALDQQHRLVGVDTTSQYPTDTSELPSVGYKRALSAEGILSLQPSLVLATDDAGPPEVLTQLQAAGVPVEMIPDEPSVMGLREKIRAVARLLHETAAGEALVTQVDADLHRVQQALSDGEHSPRVLFLLHVGSGTDLSAGQDTAADAVIQLAGGSNVLHDAFSGYKPLSPEAALSAAPEVILLTQRNLEGLGGVDGVLQRAGLASTPAAAQGRIVAMDGLLLLGFGPRLGEAVNELAGHLGTLP